MPIAAWMDERHLPPLGLANAWGYNPIVFMAPDPRIVPGGLDEVRNTVAALHQAGISVILDVVYNHTAESDEAGPTVSLRGLDNAVYYRHAVNDPGRLVNDTACGNTLACDRSPVIRLVTDAMRHWVEAAGVDGFRFDLATVLGRSERGFDPEGPLLAAILQDPILRETRLIAEPWDVGPGGYQLGNFPAPFLEWNDKFRDDMRRFWKGEGGPGALATRLAGSSDIFQATFRPPSASVNFITCHDGFTLTDLVAFSGKHNEANGQENRDGSNDNHSWNNGVEGPSSDTVVNEKRGRDIRALLAMLFLSRGTPMLTAGDEFGHTQKGNNNAYCQDNEITWLDWPNADRALVAFVAGLSRLRQSHPQLGSDVFYSGRAPKPGELPDVEWLNAAGRTMSLDDWQQADFIAVALASSASEGGPERVFVVINRASNAATINLPKTDERGWSLIVDSAAALVNGRQSVRGNDVTISACSVAVFATP
jgi:glycogen debranching enzyme